MHQWEIAYYIPVPITLAKWLEQVYQWHEMYNHDLEVMSSILAQIELTVYNTSKSYLNKTYYNAGSSILFHDTKFVALSLSIEYLCEWIHHSWSVVHKYRKG